MPFIDLEIRRQPAAWRRAAEQGLATATLPAQGERVAVVGCGTSLNIARSYAALREQRAQGETDAFSPEQFPTGRRYDRCVVISRSGTTTELVDFVAARTARSHVVALTTSVAQPLAQVADSLLLLDFADEESVVQTVFATSALSALRAHLGEDVPPLADRAESVLDEPLADAWLRAEQLTFLGRTWAYGLAEEAALKVRESAQAWTEAYPTMEYRHGPISVAQPGRVVWHLGQGGEELREQVEHTGADFVLHDDDPQVDLVRVQRLGAALAAGRGLDPDQPRHLSRAVLLER